jgi:hypothetical protein
LPPYRRPQRRWRSYRDIADAIFADQSGADQGSEARKQSGAPPVLDNVADRWMRISSLVRMAQRIGVVRRARTIVPDLADYLVEAEAEDEEAVE